MAHNYEIIKLILSHTSQMFENNDSTQDIVSTVTVQSESAIRL